VATIIHKGIFSLLLFIFSTSLFAHTIFAANDIPLLDNRVRIDPKTELVTFILNHQKGPQQVVLVRPDGSKLYYGKHPKSVRWVNSKVEDIITVEYPMAGPWQAIAFLDGDNRIRLLSKVKLKTNKLPLKLYSQEYITTHASLYEGDKLLTDPAYLKDAKLSVSLIGPVGNQLSLYQDQGRGYDALAFDGKLSARIYINLLPGRYLLSIKTKNDVFLRNVNKDAVVFLSPITYKIGARDVGSKEAVFKFKIDSEEIDPKSVIINGVVKDAADNIIKQVIVQASENNITDNILSKTQSIAYGTMIFSGKAFATTRSGREVELQLPEHRFELLKLVIPEKIEMIEAAIPEQPESKSIFENIWVLSAMVMAFLLLIATAIFIILRRRKNKASQDNDEADLSELTLEGLEPTSIDLKTTKKQTGL